MEKKNKLQFTTVYLPRLLIVQWEFVFIEKKLVTFYAKLVYS